MIGYRHPKQTTTVKVHEPTDDELMNNAIKENKRLFKEKQEKQKNEQKKLIALEKTDKKNETRS